MSIFQCENCGCAENTSCGWYHCRNSKRLTPKEYLGKALCSACAPTEYASGQNNKEFNNKWHGLFIRTFLPHGEFKVNGQGNIEHIESGLIGSKAYEKYGSDTEYGKAN